MSETAPARSPMGVDDAAVIRELMGRALRRAVDAERAGRAAGAEVGAPLREACERARRMSFRAEQLLVVLKDTWRQLPETRRLRLDGDDTLARIVTACIAEYYRMGATD